MKLYIMRFYNYKRHRCQRAIILLAFLIVIFSSIIYLFLNYMESTLLVAFEDKAKQRIIELANKSVLEVINGQKISYDDIVLLEQKQNTTSVKIDTIYVNKLVSKWILSINSKINGLMPVSIRLKLGYILKNIFLYDIGPTFEGKVLYVSAISYDIKSEFKSAGINQTIHRIYLILEFEGNLLFLNNKKSFKVTQKLPIAENIYIGEVPKVYIGK